MANQTIGVSLQFSADTAAAKRNIQDLQSTLAKLSSFDNMASGMESVDKKLIQAKESAIELKNILSKSFNQTTGKLDLRQFDASLKASGKSLKDLQNNLIKMGPDGSRAFSQLASAIMEAEIPLTKCNKLVSGLWDSLKRTAKWQLSSSIIHGFMGSLQRAYGFAQDLNKSLNNIRIVTGQSTEQMARFAKQASESAKALSTTTTAYTDASLIYYQQGLSDAEVKARTDTTIKMANVTRQSAAEVSDQMTAVWNNFAKGSDNLELFADKMVALGAATASSSDEIATGLEKFAAVADTVGLSFDYAAAALATVTATTRQSADTVGTAFKTLFSRLESLKLGESLEDGTDLTKYSAALAAVGVNIKDANGELKQMDTIIDETMDKWQTLTKDQQVALAQTVAGQRQYNQFIALMSNADFFKQNLATEAGAAGTLQSQADTYAEGWEAARDRVQAALEGVYQKILNSDDFIKLLNVAEDLITVLGKVIDAFGGINGVIGTLGTLATRLFGNQIAASIDNSIQRIRDFSGVTQRELMKTKEEAVKLNATIGGTSSAGINQLSLQLQEQAIKNADKLSESDKIRIQNTFEELKGLSKVAEARENSIEALEREIEALKERKTIMLDNAEADKESADKSLKRVEDLYIRSNKNVRANTSEAKKDEYSSSQRKAAEKFATNVSGDDLQNISDQAVKIGEEIQSVLQHIQDLKKAPADLLDKESLNQYYDDLIAKNQSLMDEIHRVKDIEPINQDNLEESEELYQNIERILIDISKIKPNQDNSKEIDKANKKIEELKKKLQALKKNSDEIDIIKLEDIKDAQQLEEKIKNLSKELKKVQDGIFDNKNTNFTKEEIKNLEDLNKTVVEVKNLQNDNIQAVNEANDKYQQLNGTLGSQKATFGDLASHITSAGFSIMSFISSTQALGEAWADNKLTLEDFSTTFTTLMNLTTTFSQIMGVLNTINTIANGIRAAKVLLMKTEIKEEDKILANKLLENNAIVSLLFKKKLENVTRGQSVVAQQKEKVSLKANTLEWIKNKLAIESHPLLGPILLAIGLVTAAIGIGLSGALKQNTKELEENAQAIEERKKKNHEEAVSAREEAETLNKQSELYHQAYNNYKNMTGSKSEYIKIASSLAEALGIEDAALLINQGRYEELTKKIEKYLETVNKTTLSQVEADLNYGINWRVANPEDTFKSASSSYALEVLGGIFGGAALSGGPLGALFGGLTTGYFGIENKIEKNDEALSDLYNELAELVKDMQYVDFAFGEENTAEEDFDWDHPFSSVWNKYINPRVKSTLSFSFNQVKNEFDAEEIGQYLQELIQFRQGLIDAGADESALKSLDASIEETSNYLRERLPNRIKGIKYVAQQTLNELSPEIKDIADAMDVRQQIINKIKEKAPEAPESLVQEIVGNLDFGNELINLQMSAISKIKALQPTPDLFNLFSLDGNISMTEEEIQKYINKLSAIDLKYLLKINIDDIEVVNEESLNAQIEKLKNDFINKFTVAGAAEKTFSTLEVGKAYSYTDISDIVEVLSEKGIDILTFFDKLEDGTYKLKSNFASLTAILEDEKVKQYKNALKDLREEYIKQSDIYEKEKEKYESSQNKYSSFKGFSLGFNALFGDNSASEFLNARDNLNNTLEEIDKISSALANSATSIKQLNGYLKDELITINDYSEAYGRLREEFLLNSVDQKELLEYTQNLLELNKETKMFGEDTEKAALAAETYARSVLRMNKGVEALSNGIDEWSSILNNKASKGSQEWYSALSKTEQAVADLLDILPDDLPDGFVEAPENLNLIKEAAKGDEEAIDALQNKLRALGETALNTAFMSATSLDDNINDQFLNLNGTIINLEDEWNNFINWVNSEDLSPYMDEQGFIDALNHMLETGLITEAELDKTLGNMNLEANYETEAAPIEETYTKPQIVQKWIPTEVSETDIYANENGQAVSVPVTRTNWELKTETEMIPITTETERMAFAMTTTGLHGEQKSRPKITGITKKASGKANNYSSVNNGGKTLNNSGSNGGSKRTPKKASNEIDRYHEVNERLDDIANNLDKIDKLKDRAYGQRHLQALDEEIALLEQQGTTLDEKIAENLKYLSDDKATVAQYGAVFDEQGRITNYNDVIRNAVARFNSGAISEEQFSAIKEALSTYEESLNQLEDLTEEKAEIIRKILDAKFEKVEYTVEIKLQATEFDNKILDWELGQLDDRDFQSAERVALYTKKASNAETDFNTNRQGIIDTLEAAGATDEQINAYLNGDVAAVAALEGMTDRAVSNLQNFTEGMIDSYDTLAEMKKAIEEELTVSWEEFNEKIEDSLNLYDHLEKKVTFFKDMTDILGLKRLGLTAEAIERINASSLNLQEKRIKSLQDQAKMNESDYLEAIKYRDAATTEADREYWEKRAKDIQDKMNEVNDNILDAGQTMIEGIKQDFEDMLDNVFAEFEDQMAGMYNSFEEMSEAFDQQKTLKDEYLPEYQKLYELNKMNRNLNQEISKLNNVANQERLRNLQKEINALQADGVQISQYDLDYLQKKYDLRLAEIALEEAQNNKNTVRLTRDSSGNYNYVYTADDSAVDSAAQKYEDALYQAQKVSEDSINSISESLLTLQKELSETLKQIWLDWENGLITTEDREAKIKRTTDFYTSQFNFINSELNKALDNNKSLYNDEYLAFAASRNLIKLEGNDFTSYFTDTLLSSILGGYTSLESYMEDYLTYLGSTTDGTGAMGKLAAKGTEMEAHIDSVLKTISGTDIANFAIDSKRELDKVDTEVGEVEDAIDTLATNGATSFSTLSSAVASAQSAMSGKLGDMKTDVTNLSEAYKELITTITGIETKYNVPRVNLGDATQVANGLNPDWNNDNPDGQPPQKNNGNNGVYYRRERSSGKLVEVRADQLTGLLDRYYPGYISKYASGGYTGDWNSMEGRLAVLHEKELVLNKEDTKNMLAAVDIVRRITSAYDLKAQARSVMSADIRRTMSNYENALNNIEQQIHIDASFPGVTAREEIEQAFSDLAIQALAYAHRY